MTSPAAQRHPDRELAEECECGHALARHDEDGCLMFVVRHDGEAACPCWTPPDPRPDALDLDRGRGDGL